MKNKKTIILSVVLVAVLLIAAATYYFTRPDTQVGAKTITVVVSVDGKADETFTINTDAEYLAEALAAHGLISGTESEFGLMIDTVNGIKADEAKQEWWCITKGGEDVFSGAGELAIEDGDQYEFTLTVGW